jgi:hypothetical protein
MSAVRIRHRLPLRIGDFPKADHTIHLRVSSCCRIVPLAGELIVRIFLSAVGIAISFLVGWILGGASSPPKMAAYFQEILSDSKTTAAIASAIFALASLLVQFLVGSKQAVIGTRQAEAARVSSEAASLTARTAWDRAIAAMRIEWITELKKTISEYHSILMTSKETTASETHRKLSDLGTQLDLLLNVDVPLKGSYGRC